MNHQESIFRFGRWQVACRADDGARLSAVAFDGIDLLTAPPPHFEPTGATAGPFEHRPVFGYDDCWPGVDACTMPELWPASPDHGELCFLPWHVERQGDALVCRVRSRLYDATFLRTLHFGPRTIRWDFSVESHGGNPLPFLHAMHGLMPPENITRLRLPPFASATDEGSGKPFPISTPEELERFLLTRPTGFASTVLVSGLREGRVELGLRSGLSLSIRYPTERMPTLAIWWNVSAWPPEVGLRRRECAFEPLTGSCSSLSRALADGTCPIVQPGRRYQWHVLWEVTSSPA